ncbi:MAG TPA: SCO6880 family protein [Acidimicrobiales bacterium]|nr:SCO6880 family protein [Acidimicrobiales bacterium]
MSAPGSTPTVRFGRRSSRGLLLGFSTPRVVVFGLAVAAAVVGLLSAEGRGLVASAVLWVPLAAAGVVRVGGRPVVEWAATALHFAGRRARGQTEFRAQVTRRRPAGTLALHGDAARLRVHLDPDSGAAMVHDPHAQTLSAALEVSHPAYVMLDADERSRRVGAWGRVLAGLAQSGTLSCVQVLEATVPDPGDGPADWFAEHGRPEGWAGRRYRSLLESCRVGSSTHRSTVAIALDLKAAARQVKAAGGGLAGAAAVLRQDLAGLGDALRQAGLTVAGPMGEAALAAAVRGAYDPAVIVDARRDPGANLAHAGPLALSERWDRLRHDSGWSAVLWISEWPRIDVAPDFLHPLVFAPGVRRTLSLIARPLPTDAALRQLRKDRTEAVADQAHTAKVGQIADLSDAQEYEDLLARERSVIAGHTDVEFTGFVTVTAPTVEALEAAVAAVMRAAGSAGCELRPLYGAQAQGFVLAALPLARSSL